MEILIVDDDPADVELTVEGLKSAKLAININSVSDGEKALAYLRRQPPYENATRPDLVFLDLNMPRMDGRQVLERMKGDPRLRSIPVVVLTTSAAETDVAHSYNLGANCYVTKPVDLDGFIKVIHSIEEFWLTVVKLPKDEK
ncbi:MAG: response regulator [Thermodesulfobacteriota bacterium]